MAPLQAVTGRSSPLPAQLLAQVASGKVKFRLNQELERDEALRRAERIRASAVEAYHWLDGSRGSSEGLVRRDPVRRSWKESVRGTSVYVYEPAAGAEGSGQETTRRQFVVGSRCGGVRGEGRHSPEENLGADPGQGEELSSGEDPVWLRATRWCRLSSSPNALKDVQEQLRDGTIRVVEEGAGRRPSEGRPIKEKPTEQEPAPKAASSSSSSSSTSSTSTEKIKKGKITKEQEKKRTLLHDVPECVRKAARVQTPAGDPLSVDGGAEEAAV